MKDALSAYNVNGAEILTVGQPRTLPSDSKFSPHGILVLPTVKAPFPTWAKGGELMPCG